MPAVGRYNKSLIFGARHGYDVGLLARGRAGLRGAAADVEALGRRAVMVPTDVADAKAVEDAADRVERDLGPIDVWVNNAMTTVYGRALDVSADEFEGWLVARGLTR